MERTTATAVLIDNTDLEIIKLLSWDCRTPFSNIASTIGISTNAIKTRVANLISKKIIQKFIVVVNPVTLGYESECMLIIRYHNSRMIREEDIMKKVSLLGDILAHATLLGEAALFYILVKAGGEEIIELIIDLLKPGVVESRFARLNPVSMNTTISDLRIIKCMLSDARMEIADIAKQASISSRT